MISSVSLQAEDFTVNGIKYNGDEATMTATVIGTENDFNETDVVIPEIVNGYTVTRIGYKAFQRNNVLCSFEMPNSVATIEKRAFYECTNLQSVKLSNTLETIDDNAFTGTESIQEIDLPNSLTSIGIAAFSGSGISSIHMSNSLTTIGSSCFNQCNNIKDIIIPNSVKKIGSYAFDYCSNLTSVFISESVTELEQSISGDITFMNCPRLSSIVIDDNNPIYDSRENSNAIIRRADNCLMRGCINTTIPNSVTSIYQSAFYGSGVQTMAIPNNVYYFGNYIFDECNSLVSISLPNNMMSIPDGMFQHCESLSSIKLPNSITSIGVVAFSHCYSLTNIQIPDGVKTISDRAFRHTGLQVLNTPNHLESIGSGAYRGCADLTTITLKENVNSIERLAFTDCNKLKSVTSLITEPFEFDKKAFENYNSETGEWTFTSATLYVPKGCKEKYKATAGWNQFKTILEEGELSGDVNGNGTVDADDMLCVSNYILGKNPSPFNESAADLTGNGVVDIEDVTSLVDVILSGKTHGYFYFGTTEPTAENFTSLPGAVASYTSIGEAVGVSASVDAGQIVYMLCPATWMKGKYVEVEDGDGNSYDFIEDTDAGTISGYVIYKTQAFNEATDVMLKFNISSAETYYWYVGQTDPSSMNSIDPIVTDTSSPGWRVIGDSLPEYSSSNMLYDGISNGISLGSIATYYLALPSNTLKVYDDTGYGGVLNDAFDPAVTKTIEGVTYYVYKYKRTAKKFGNNIY